MQQIQEWLRWVVPRNLKHNLSLSLYEKVDAYVYTNFKRYQFTRFTLIMYVIIWNRIHVLFFLRGGGVGGGGGGYSYLCMVEYCRIGLTALLGAGGDCSTPWEPSGRGWTLCSICPIAPGFLYKMRKILQVSPVLLAQGMGGGGEEEAPVDAASTAE